MALNVTVREAERIVLGSMTGLVISFLEFISQRRVQIVYSGLNENLETLKNGAIIVTAHTGNWDILEQAAFDKNIRLGVITRRSRFLPLQSFVEYIRRRRHETVFGEDVGIPVLMGFLRDKGVLGIVIDQNMPPRRGRPALFFGKEVNTTFAPQILSVRSGLPIIPVFVRRVNAGRYEILFHKPHFVKSSADEDIRASMDTLNGLLEEFIRKYPDQWLWVHRRFKPLVR